MKPKKPHHLSNRRTKAIPAAAFPTLALAIALAGMTHAATVTLNATDAAGTTSFNTNLHWDNGALPSAGNAYFTAAFVLRTPVTVTAGQVLTFGGDSLTVDPGGRLLGKFNNNATADFSNGTGLFLNGAQVHMAGTGSDSVIMSITGNITLSGGTTSFGALAPGSANAGNFETLNIAGTMSGSGAITVAGAGAANNNGDNTGVVRIGGSNPGYTGTITVAQPKAVASATNRLLQLGNVNALQNATLNLTATTADPVSFAAAANTGSFNIGTLSGSIAQRLADTSNMPVALNVGGNNGSSTYSGALTGPGSIVKSGTGTLTLTGPNTYSGNTTVSGGTLVLNSATLADTSTVSISGGTILDLPHGSQDKVAALILNGVSQPAGVYTSANSGGLITGTGSIEVAGSQHVVMTASDLGTAMVATSLNSDIGNWSPAGVPSALHTYSTGGFIIRTPATQVNQNLTFGGASLSLDANGRFLGKVSAGNTGNASIQTLTINLILNGGLFDQAAGGGNSQGTLVVQGSVNVTQDSVLGAFGDNLSRETLEIAAPISGSAGLTIAGSSNGGGNKGTVRLSAANSYSGTITLLQPTGGDFVSATNRLLQLSHTDALQNASLVIGTSQADAVSFAAAANSGAFRVGSLAGTGNQSLQDTSSAPVILEAGGNDGTTDYHGALTGAGSLVKTGTGTLSLFGVNSYAGNTTVNGGTLHVESATLSDTGTVSIAAGASLDLFDGTDVVGGLVLNGVSQPAGTYDSTNSGGLITGAGKLQVNGPAGGFSVFMDGFAGLSTADKLPGADPDKDGIPNLVEYALAGFDPTVPNQLATALASGTLSFTKRPEAVTNNDIVYTIETSSTLGSAPGDWTTAAGAVNDPSTISYTLPTGLGKIFARLHIVKP